MTRSAVVLPYRTLDPAAVFSPTDGWNVIVGDENVVQIVNGGAFPAWDAKVSFRMQRTFRIDVSIREALGTEESDCYVFVVTASSANGLLRKVLFREDVVGRAWSDIHVDITPDSDLLARDLVVTSGVYLARDVQSSDPLVPTLCGSRLWEMTERFRLEGGAARLPMYEVDFSKAFPGDAIDSAEFHIEVSDDPDAEVEATIAVYLNSKRHDFIREVRIAGSGAERRLWAGVIRRTLVWAIMNDVDVASAGDPSALSATVARWIRSIWPALRPEQVRDLPAAGYSRLEAQIDSWIDRMQTARNRAVVR